MTLCKNSVGEPLSLPEGRPKPNSFCAHDFQPDVSTRDAFLERLALRTVDKPLPQTYYFPMAAERLRKRIEHLLNEAE